MGELRRLLEEALLYAEVTELYGGFAELELLLCRHQFADALQMIRRIRLQDNVAISRSHGRFTKLDLESNEQRLLILERLIKMMIQAARESPDTDPLSGHTTVKLQEQ